jgi:hypothetical protein
MKHMKYLIILYFIIPPIISLYFISCSTTSWDDNWEFLGRQIVGIDSVAAVLPNGTFEFTDTVKSTDTLSLYIYSHTINGDNYENDTLNVVASSSTVNLLLEADIYDFVGSGVMPPTDLWPNGLDGLTLDLPPPFEIGYFVSILHQPNGSTKLDTIIVIK